MKYNHIYPLLLLLQLSKCPLQVPSHHQAIFFVYVNPLSTVSPVQKYTCVCVGGGIPWQASIGIDQRLHLQKSNSLNFRNYQKLLNKYQRSGDDLPHLP